MKIERLKRNFRFNGVDLMDINPGASPEEIRSHYATTLYPELLNAKIKGPRSEGNTEVWSFEVQFGEKG